jgi:hypothetical protein
MIDDYHWNFTGTGFETNGETRVRPWPGWNYYENAPSRAEMFADQLGLAVDDVPE